MNRRKTNRRKTKPYCHLLYQYVRRASFAILYYEPTNTQLISTKYIQECGPGSSVGIATELRAG